jgi:hypothetical protein
MRSRTALLSAALVTGLLPSLSFATSGQAVAESGSANLTHVANLPHAVAAGATAAAKGSDIEFATLDVTGLPQAEARAVSGVREFAVAGTITIDGVRNSGMQIIDITDPENPQPAGLFECTNSQGDVQVFTRDDLDGRTFATYTTDSSGTTSSKCYQDAREKGFTTEDSGTFIVEITNPYAPQLVQFVTIPRGSHNQTVHPSGKYLYNSNNELTRGQGFLEYFDITDLTSPVKLGELPLETGIDSHDITFNAEGTRAYSAAITHTVIINTEDPAKPSVVGRVLDPTLGIQHQADPVTIDDPVLGERTFLAITDEFAGAAGNGWCPGGGVGIYDITGNLEATPVRVGYWNIPEARVAGAGNGTGESLRCTSHVLRFYPEQKLMTIGWYNAGTRIVDISGLVGASVGVTPATGNLPMGMREVAYRWFDNSETWAAKIHRFEADGSAYVFANDLERGLDVFKYEPDAPPSADGGEWLTAGEVALKPRYEYTLGNLVPLCASPLA